MLVLKELPDQLRQLCQLQMTELKEQFESMTQYDFVGKEDCEFDQLVALFILLFAHQSETNCCACHSLQTKTEARSFLAPKTQMFYDVVTYVKVPHT